MVKTQSVQLKIISQIENSLDDTT